MKKKLSKNGGFTLVEMLIVVAIIAILVAVSIPLISRSLEKARDATDQANERAAKAEAAILLLQTADYATIPGENATTVYNALIGSTGAFYDAVNGKITSTAPGGVGYGKCTGTGGITGYCISGKKHSNGYINISYDNYSADASTYEYTIPWTGADS